MLDLIDMLFSHEENWVISTENSEPWSQDHNHRPKFHLPWWHFLKNWNLKQHDLATPMKLKMLLLLFDCQNIQNKFRTHSPHVQICC